MRPNLNRRFIFEITFLGMSGVLFAGSLALILAEKYLDFSGHNYWLSEKSANYLGGVFMGIAIICAAIYAGREERSSKLVTLAAAIFGGGVVIVSILLWIFN